MGPKIVQHDSLDREPRSPQAPAGDHSWSRPQRPAFDWRGLGVLCLFALFGLLITYWLFGRDVRYWIQFGGGGWVPNAAILIALAFLVKRFLLVEQPGGYKVLWFRADEREVIAGMLRVQQAEAARMFAEARQLTLTGAPAQQQQIEEDYIDGDLVEPPIALLPPAEWLPWFDARPHGLLAAETGGGKSTLFKLITKSRIERGELVFLLDPHSSDWFGLPGIGGGEDWEAIWCGMQTVIEEYRARLDARELYLQQFGREKPTEDFPRITVLLDEANTACRKFSIAKRGKESRWEQFAEALGSGARKVNLSIQLLAQSPNVEDLELSRPMLNNFTRICLDAYTAQLLVQKSLDTKEQKQALTEAIQGQKYPAATTIKGYAVLLDRTGLDRIASPIRPDRALWVEGYQRAEQLIAEMRTKQQRATLPARPVVSASAQASPSVRTSVAQPTFSPAELLSAPAPDGRTADGQRTRLYLKAMAGAGKTRAEIRARMDALNMPFENKLLTEVRKELGLSE